MDHQFDSDNLRGVRGWLIFYIIATGTGIVANGPVVHDYFAGNLPASGFVLFTILLLQVGGVALIFFCRRPVTRLFHVGLYGGLLLLVILELLESPEPQDANAILGTAIWLIYWLFSERVRATFRPSPSHSESSPVG